MLSNAAYSGLWMVLLKASLVPWLWEWHNYPKIYST